MYSDKCFRSHCTPHSKDRRAKRLRQGRADDLAAWEGSYLQPSALPHRATVRQMALHARLLRRGCVAGFLRICRKAPFPGLTGRRRGRQVRGRTPPSSGCAALRPSPRLKLPASSSRSPMGICRPPGPAPPQSRKEISPCGRFLSSGEAQVSTWLAPTL